MPNTNMLEGMQCPKCGSEGPFRIVCTSTVLIYDDGTDDFEWTNWEPDSWCQCVNCEFAATARDFGLEDCSHA